MIGKLMSLSVVYDGSGFPFLAPWVLQYISTEETRDLAVLIDDIPFPGVKIILRQVRTKRTLVYCTYDDLISCKMPPQK